MFFWEDSKIAPEYLENGILGVVLLGPGMLYLKKKKSFYLIMGTKEYATWVKLLILS